MTKKEYSNKCDGETSRRVTMQHLDSFVFEIPGFVVNQNSFESLGFVKLRKRSSRHGPISR